MKYLKAVWDFVTGFWRDANLKPSNTRLHTTMIILLTCWVVYYIVVNDKINMLTTALIGTLLSYAGLARAMQDSTASKQSIQKKEEVS